MNINEIILRNRAEKLAEDFYNDKISREDFTMGMIDLAREMNEEVSNVRSV
jgi:hypothetical protein